MNLLEAFGLNWKIFLGQVINFLILVYLLKKFVFPSFLKILSEREKTIKNGIEKQKEAEEKLKMAEKEREKILKEAKEKAEMILKEVEQISQKEREKILLEAEKEKEIILEKAKKIAESEMKKREREIMEKNLELVFLLTEKILKEKIDQKKEREIIERFLKNLEK